jgi:heat shock protein HslJ
MLLSACQLRPALPGSHVQNTHWELIALNGEAFLSPMDEAPFFLELHRNGTMDAWAGCNVLHGAYQYEKDVVRVGPFAELRRQCSPEAMALERRVMRAYEGASHYRLEAGQLILLNPIGIEQARFKVGR